MVNTRESGMSTFTGSFQIEGDTSSLPATVSIEHDMLRLVSRSHLIGEWPMADVDVEETDGGVMIRVEGERVHLDLTDQRGFVLAAGVLRKPPEAKTGRRGRKRRQAEPSERPAAAPIVTEEGKAPERRSSGDVIRGWIDELRPDFEEVRRTAQATPRGRILWVTLLVFAVATAVVPTVVVIVLTSIGTIATLLSVFGYLDNSIRVRFPNRLPPIVVLTAGLALLVIAVLVASIPDHPLRLL